jgi:hypothetical protein
VSVDRKGDLEPVASLAPRLHRRNRILRIRLLESTARDDLLE